MTVPDELVRAVRDEHGQIVAVLTRVLGSLDEAEDVVQSACERALADWPVRGVPTSPGAWLTTVARRIALDRLRRRATERRVHERLTHDLDDAYAILERWPDERMRLIALCCSPALDPADRVALTLREVCGLSTREVAEALLLPDATLAQRLVRAKRRLRARSADLGTIDPTELEDRAPDVLAVVSLIFNAGYAPPSGERALDEKLCELAIDLGTLVVALLPDGTPGSRSDGAARAEAMGLLAMMRLTHARRAARTDAGGIPVPLDEQDRSLWHREEAAAALALLDRAERAGHSGPYLMKARLSAIHHRAASAEQTDWAALYETYQRLLELEPTPVVELNAAVALGRLRGPEAALAELDRLVAVHGSRLERYPWLHAAVGYFCAERAPDLARAAYARARALAGNEAERTYLDRRLAELTSPPPSRGSCLSRSHAPCSGRAPRRASHRVRSPSREASARDSD